MISRIVRRITEEHMVDIGRDGLSGHGAFTDHSGELQGGTLVRARRGWRATLAKAAAALAATLPFVTPSIARADYWTGWFSEEDPPGICAGGHLIGGVRCRNPYCDDMSLYCVSAGIRRVGNTYWAPGISEEQPNTTFVCPGNEYVTGIDCYSGYCNEVSLQCADIVEPRPATTDCHWTGWLSEEGGGELRFSAGYYMAGAQCSGSYCDNMRFYICRV